MWEQLENKKRQFKRRLPTNHLPKDLQDDFYTNLIYISSNFEDIQLSWDDAARVVAGAQFSEPEKSEAVLQAEGQLAALNLVEEWAFDSLKLPRQFIQQLHATIFSKVSPALAGKYRTEGVKLKGTKFMPMFPFMISVEMDELTARIRSFVADSDKLRAHASMKDVIHLASASHYDLVRIHPFRDGNGRVARILLNLVLRCCHLPYVILPKTALDEEYRRCLRAANIGNLEPFALFTSKLLESSLDKCLSWASADAGSV